jgi:hypothetical protein
MKQLQTPLRLFRQDSQTHESPHSPSNPAESGVSGPWSLDADDDRPAPVEGLSPRAPESVDGRSQPPVLDGSGREDSSLTVLSSAETGATLDVSGKERGGVHALTKTTDFWFDLEVSRIERKAVEEAVKWAQAGLPRHDLSMEEDLPVETSLTKLCVETYRRWIEKVKTKVQDAIEGSAQDAARAIAQLRYHVGALSQTHTEMEHAQGELRQVMRENHERQVTFGYGHLMEKRTYFTLVALLVLVDWIANVPIFAELLPQEPGATEHWRTLSSQAERYGLFAGLYRLCARVLFSPDVTLLALGVILFLMFLGHVLGDSIRALVALRDSDVPRAKTGINAHRRQFPLMATASGVGILLVIGALTASRMQIETVTQQRYEAATLEVSRLEGVLAQATSREDVAGIGDAQKRLVTVRKEVEERQKRFEYAAGITAMNLPILLLNLVLVIAAAVAAYLTARTSVTNEVTVDPRVVDLKEQLQRLRQEAGEHRRSIHQIDVEVQIHVAHVNYLLKSDPLEGWEGKAQRLRRVIPVFRSENARGRGLDPASIIAFQRPHQVVLPEIPRGQLFSPPAGLGDIVAAHQQLRAEALAAERDSRTLRVEDAAA